MTVACSVIMICSPVNIFLEKDKLSLKPGTVILATRSIRALFLMHYGKIKIIDINQEIVSRYLESEHRLARTYQTDIPLYLMLDARNPVLVGALITSQGFSGDTTDMFVMMACLSLFESDELMPLFLGQCLTSVSHRVRAIIQTDISANWMLGAIALRLHMSESLLKIKLKNEGHMFSRLLLEERMRVAVNMLCSRDGYGQAVAEKCGYSSKSYFISVFHRYYGLPPDRYVSVQGVEF
ncbi:helix-turn-helix domain-containing protein [Escherichia coli]|uniref:helix-turn-helix domain-containing protein n=1 Tax=Escherichia coli TaxID=562 RepID=UPI0023015F8F|nr:helix-turn-helix domain-containing protein [Escherichia coli]MDA6302209.1 helix-turn-helix domain-containing protein [Escherichia coli]MDZ4916243.1 helix-turn-helix domain-containing protein [Escherichia coli]MDZ4927392.1 helix-turn-helix domain-containing protein [Escherichia coli]MDZ4959234.1 helix-turn-helix domain-containing protein [Escherichia coli]HDL6452172.1 helix-turn-helix domain-containing protein [Escherichia coli]